MLILNLHFIKFWPNQKMSNNLIRANSKCLFQRVRYFSTTNLVTPTNQQVHFLRDVDLVCMMKYVYCSQLTTIVFVIRLQVGALHYYMSLIIIRIQFVVVFYVINEF